MSVKIDSHQHFWNYNPGEFAWIGDNMGNIKRDFGPAELLSAINNTGFDGTISVQARQHINETDWLLKLSDENSFIKGVVGWVNLCSSDLEKQLEEYSTHSKFVGVRHVIHDEPDDNFILRPDFIKGIKQLKKYRLTYDLLIFNRHLPQTLTFVNKFPDQVFVLDHIAKPDIKNKKISSWKENIKNLGKHENVYCKISGMVTEADWLNWKDEDFEPYLDVVVESFGTDRLMVGSDWPVCLVAGCYDKVMQIAFNYFSKFSENEKNKIFGLNAIKAYQLGYSDLVP